jgi:hypothetical protein
MYLEPGFPMKRRRARRKERIELMIGEGDGRKERKKGLLLSCSLGTQRRTHY